MLYEHTIHTTVPHRIRHNDPHAAAEHERLDDRGTQSAANHDHTGTCKKQLHHSGEQGMTALLAPPCQQFITPPSPIPHKPGESG